MIALRLRSGRRPKADNGGFAFGAPHTEPEPSEANSSRTTMNGVAVRVALSLGVDLGEHFADDLGRLVGREGVAAL